MDTLKDEIKFIPVLNNVQPLKKVKKPRKPRKPRVPKENNLRKGNKAPLPFIDYKTDPFKDFRD